jgi:hypothetical protein
MTTTTLPRRRYGSEYPTWAMLRPAGIELPKQVKAANDLARGLGFVRGGCGAPGGKTARRSAIGAVRGGHTVLARTDKNVCRATRGCL